MRDEQAALVIGASSATGRYFLERAARQPGLKLLAVSRRKPDCPMEGVTWLRHDLAHGPVPVSAETLVSFGPVGLAVRQLEAMPGIGRVVALSSASTEFKRESTDPAERAQMAAILADEARLRALCGARGAGLSLFKTTMIYGGGRDGNVSRLAGLTTRLPLIPVTGNGLRQPVHADDLAELALRVLAMDERALGTWLLGGGETLDYRALLRRIASVQGRRVLVLRVPGLLLKAALKAAHVLGRMRDVRPVMLERQAVDLVVDDQAARERLGWNPRPFRPF